MKKDATLIMANELVHMHATLSIDGNTKSISLTNRVRVPYSEWRTEVFSPYRLMAQAHDDEHNGSGFLL